MCLLAFLLTGYFILPSANPLLTLVVLSVRQAVVMWSKSVMAPVVATNTVPSLYLAL